MSYRVLIVDDEMPTIRLIQNIIDKYASAFRVAHTCTSGEKALEYLTSQSVDLVITDISMHGMTGIDLAKKVRALFSDIHIVIVSGYAEFEYAQGAIQASVDDYILKPVSIAQLVRVMESVLEKLNGERLERISSLLPAIATGRTNGMDDDHAVFGSAPYRFALVRWGGLDMRLKANLRATSLVLPMEGDRYVLRGRDAEPGSLLCARASTSPAISISVRPIRRASRATHCR